jgi:hypothetical protein
VLSREPGSGYDFAGKNITLKPENAYFWDAIL